jgi:eukaryotic-like serine/threonine-protein kinase
MIGSTLSNFEIKSKLGEGGMGEVWLAEDTKLGREVALKLLPADVAGDADRLARFEREAKVLASLNHPNIATLYGLETVPSCHPERAQRVEGSPEVRSDAEGNAPSQSSGDAAYVALRASRNSSTHSSDSFAQGDSAAVTFLVMELVDGEDLSERISRGPVPVDEAVAIALQIAEALEAAHEQGIVHRDLKPANIKVRPDGTVKVLDFGLAKAWDTQNSDASLSLSPTLTQHATAAGVIIGTAAYMSPEQAAGIAADRRADIWAFGVVLWEMLTGHKLFDGETVSHVLASVLKDEIDLDELPAETPPHLRKLIGRCLRKKPKRRLQAIGDARIALEEPEDEAQAAMEMVADQGNRSRLGWIAAAVFGVAAVALALVLGLSRGPEPRVIHAAIPTPPDTVFHLDPLNPGAAVLSPDGSMIVFSARQAAGAYQLYLRSVSEGEAHVLSGTDNGHYPFWSPDNEWIGFVADGKLRKIKAAGGPALTICDAPDGKGGSWNDDGVIVFAPESGTPLHRVAAVGGESTPITEFDLEAGDNSHRLPRFLPDGEHLLYWARNSSGDAKSVVRVIGIDEGGSGRDLVTTPASGWFAGGYLLFVRDEMLMAQAFDPEAIEFTGDAFPVAEDVVVRALTGVGVFSTTDGGDLLYQTGSRNVGSILQFFDRQGNPGEAIADEAYYDHVALSPDGSTAAVVMLDQASGTRDIWLVDVGSGLKTRFTFDPANDAYPVWSPDGEVLIFASRRNGTRAIYRKTVGGTGEVELVYASEVDMLPTSWSPDGRYLLFDQVGQTTAADLWVLDLEGGPSAELFYQTDTPDGAGYFSPDGRWVAYWSQESGRGEAYVTPFPGPGRRWQVSQNSGTWMQWRPDGTELFVQEENGPLKVIPVDGAGQTFTYGEARDVMVLGNSNISGILFSISPDGQRVLASVASSDQQTGHLDLVAGWSTTIEED